MSDWKPGDVARIDDDILDDAARTLFRTEAGWVDAEGDGRPAVSDVTVTRIAHRLAVIDPEDRAQVDRLLDAFLRHPTDMDPERYRSGYPEAYDRYADAMRAALREYADPRPPKPDEPTGLGAVVEDAGGRRWVRASTLTTVRHWRGCDDHSQGRRRYAEIDAVRVLSEGVPDAD